MIQKKTPETLMITPVPSSSKRGPTSILTSSLPSERTYCPNSNITAQLGNNVNLLVAGNSICFQCRINPELTKPSQDTTTQS